MPASAFEIFFEVPSFLRPPEIDYVSRHLPEYLSGVITDISIRIFVVFIPSSNYFKPARNIMSQDIYYNSSPAP
jgi:hypothetical protein